MDSWDRTHDWIVNRIFHERARLTIRFNGNSPTVSELIAIRKCLPQFRHVPPTQLRASIGNSRQLELGEMPTREARQISEAARIEGLDASVENASFISYLAEDRTMGGAWLIEDYQEACRLAESMIAAGVPVRDIEA